jgi:hypothetical protein
MLTASFVGHDPKRARETLVLEFFQSAGVNGTVRTQALGVLMATTKMIAGLMGPTLLAIGIAMLVNARHFPEMAKQIGNDPGTDLRLGHPAPCSRLGNRARA